ncbi:MAG: 4-alpha-glucanotransferase [Pyrinomonadaceae bacterium]
MPLQDVIGLGNEARMNLPASTQRNWAWRYLPDQLTPAMGDRLRTITETYGRAPQPKPAEKKLEK